MSRYDNFDNFFDGEQVETIEQPTVPKRERGNKAVVAGCVAGAIIAGPIGVGVAWGIGTLIQKVANRGSHEDT